MSMSNQPELSEQLEALKEILVAYATGGAGDAQGYKELRKAVLSNQLVKNIIPEFLRNCRNLEDFWHFIKREYQHYAERREFLWRSFAPLFQIADESSSSPVDENAAAALKRFDAESVHKLWNRALERRDEDPEGAITIARTLLETICKHILDERQILYAADSDLPHLYKETAKSLNIAPSQHSEIVFKQILGGCTAVVEGLGALRNRLSDAHGQGKRPVRPAARHAELAVNLAGAVAVFLVLTYETADGKAQIQSVA
jgi:hypothetical protein